MLARHDFSGMRASSEARAGLVGVSRMLRSGSIAAGLLLVFATLPAYCEEAAGVVSASAFGVKPNDGTDEAAAMAKADAAANGGAVVYGPGTYSVATNLTLAGGLVMTRGAVISVAPGRVLTVNGDISAGDFQIFAGEGTFKGAGFGRVSAAWWGAKGGARVIGDGRIDAGTPRFTSSAQANFTASDVGAVIDIAGAGPSGAVCSQSIKSVESRSSVTLSGTCPTTMRASAETAIAPKDDAAAIQAAETAAATNGVHAGTIDFPCTSYLIRRGVRTHGIETWRGCGGKGVAAGSRIVSFAPDVALDVVGGAGNNSIDIADIGFAGPAQSAIKATAIRIGGTTNVADARLFHVWLTNFYYLIDCKSCSQVHFDDVALENGTYGIYSVGGIYNWNIMWGGTVFAVTHGVFLQGSDEGNNTRCRYNVFGGGLSFNTVGNGLSISHGCDDNTISGISVAYTNVGGPSGTCLFLAGSRGNTISGSTLTKCGGDGIILSGEGGDSIVGNEIISADNQRSAGASGIEVDTGTSGTTIHSNTIWAYPGENLEAYGIDLNTTGANDVAANNILPSGYRVAAYHPLAGNVQGGDVGTPLQVPYGLSGGDPTMAAKAPWIKWCNVKPEGVVAAPRGSVCLYTGGSGPALFVKESEGGAAGWSGK